MRAHRRTEWTENSSLRRSVRHHWYLVCVCLSLGLILQGCALYLDRPAPENEATPLFVPPTRVPPQTKTEALALTDTPPTAPAPSCEDNLTFISDLTIPDGSQVPPGSALDKRWQVRNSGTCNWDERYSLRLIAGERLGVAERLALYPARSETDAVIHIVFQAPSEAGSYRSAWQAFNPAGEPFGDLIFIDILVTE